ncbi:MAG TPA: hypothetical protein VEC11_17090 [Allosphingosinicella sp.]|nr:hypothetical protein [Allosphingosinicella sp.]
MQIVNATRFVIGMVFLVVAVGLFLSTRGERGFGQLRQAAVMCLLAAGIFTAIGLGWLDL